MKDTLTAEEMIEYVTLTKKTPQTVRFVARVNALLAQDESLRRRVAAMEALYDSLTLPPAEARKALLSMEEQDALHRYQN